MYELCTRHPTPLSVSGKSSDVVLQPRIHVNGKRGLELLAPSDKEVADSSLHHA